MQAASAEAARRFAKETGALPTHTPEATAARREANREQAIAQRAWDRTAPQLDQRWYLEEVAPALAALTLPAIAKATGVSTSAASKWRAGRTTPHPRHWQALGRLIGILDELPGPRGAEVVTFERVADLREQCAEDWMLEQASAMFAAEEAETADEPLATVAEMVAR